MISHTTEEFWKALTRLPPTVQRQARKAYRLFRANPYHTSLHFKKVDPEQPIYSARVSKGYRAVAAREGDVLIWFWIGTHADYDQMLRRR